MTKIDVTTLTDEAPVFITQNGYLNVACRAQSIMHFHDIQAGHAKKVMDAYGPDASQEGMRHAADAVHAAIKFMQSQAASMMEKAAKLAETDEAEAVLLLRKVAGLQSSIRLLSPYSLALRKAAG